jgi:hypothetical protein
MKLELPQLIDLPKNLDARGNLSFLEENTHIPFEINRVYWIYDVPGGETRGGHAYQDLEEAIVALSGSFDVRVHNGESESVYSLNRSYTALYLPKMMWRKIENFSTNAVALVVASLPYNESDYIRDFDTFRTLSNANK